MDSELAFATKVTDGAEIQTTDLFPVTCLIHFSTIDQLVRGQGKTKSYLGNCNDGYMQKRVRETNERPTRNGAYPFH